MAGNLKPSDQPANSVKFSPTGELLAAGYEDGVVRIWRVSDWTPTDTLFGQQGPVTSIAFAPQTVNCWRLPGSTDQVDIWKVQIDEASGLLEKNPAWVLNGHTGAVNSIDFSPDSRRIASASDDQTIQIWNIPEP